MPQRMLRSPGGGRPPRRPAAAILAAGLVLAGLALAAQQLTVQVHQTQLRQRPSYLGAGVAPVPYGLRVTVLAEQGPWRQVRTPDGRQGWLHVSALTDRKLQLRSGATDAATGAEVDEIALAGKGFTAEVERSFREQNAEVDFTWVDRMAGWSVTPEQAAAFLAAGEVVPREGGGR